ncbi:MAG: hypothetical protein SFV23_07115 [Planctomycetaceae bacterium]|nr:hypothetical protein [Planctomycetaceae bacterium]
MLAEAELRSAAGSAGPYTCANPALVNSNCNQCLSNGNGGSVMCLNNPQGYALSSYTNPQMHYGPITFTRTSQCGGNAYNYLYDTSCTYGQTHTIIPCGRTYQNDYVQGGQATTCP